jgi:hypothetical protein
VTILAYVAGEEDFIDTSGDNVYQCGEAFTDLGIAYRDDTMTNTAVNSYIAGEFTVPRAALTSTCVAGVERTIGDGVAGTHDAVWGAVDVRKQAVMVFATSGASITLSGGGLTSTSLTFTVADLNPISSNSIPTGSTIAVVASDNTPGGANCSIVSGQNTIVPNSLTPLTMTASYSGCSSSDLVTVNVTTPSGRVSTQTFTVP